MQSRATSAESLYQRWLILRDQFSPTKLEMYRSLADTSVLSHSLAVSVCVSLCVTRRDSRPVPCRLQVALCTFSDDQGLQLPHLVSFDQCVTLVITGQRDRPRGFDLARLPTDARRVAAQKLPLFRRVSNAALANAAFVLARKLGKHNQDGGQRRKINRKASGQHCHCVAVRE